MSTLLRTYRNLRKIGIRDYLHQMQYIGDTKAGTYIATDRYGNKYYENLQDELPRTQPPSHAAVLASILLPSPAHRNLSTLTTSPSANTFSHKQYVPGGSTTNKKSTVHVRSSQAGTRGCHTWSISPRRKTRSCGWDRGVGRYRSIGRT